MIEKISSDRKSKLREIIFSILIYTLIFGYILLKEGGLILVGVFSILYILIISYFLFNKLLTTVIIDSDVRTIILEFSNLWNYKVVRKTTFDNITYTYKKEHLYTFTSGKALRFYINNRKAVKIKLNTDGWNENLMDNLVLLLEKYKIERKFIGHTLKDMWPEKQ